VRREQQGKAYFADLQARVDNLIRSINPPPEAESQVIYVAEDQGTPRLGHEDFNADLMKRALPWW